MRPTLLFVLLFVWIFAIITPSVVSLLGDQKGYEMVLNTAEEEPAEKGEQDADEKLLSFADLEEVNSDYVPADQHFKDCSLALLNCSLKVFLPPPEQAI